MKSRTAESFLAKVDCALALDGIVPVVVAASVLVASVAAVVAFAGEGHNDPMACNWHCVKRVRICRFCIDGDGAFAENGASVRTSFVMVVSYVSR